MSEFKCEVVIGSAGRHKLTVSPLQRRITLKIASDSDQLEQTRVVEFFKRVAKKVAETTTVSMRGWMQIGDTKIELRNDAGNHCQSFSQEDKS